MKLFFTAGLFAALGTQLFAAGKLTFEDEVELIRGLTAENAKAKTYFPRSKKPIEYDSGGTWDKQAWLNAGEKLGPAARVGDEVKITRVTLENDKIILELNGGIKSGSHWYDHVQAGMGNATQPVSNGGGTPSTGTYIAIVFHKPLEPMKAADVKKMLAPILDFDKHSATEIYAETLPPEIKAAIAAKRAEPGMDQDQVRMALGRPTRSPIRETIDDVEYEDWVFGTPPGKITFVTFNGNKCVKVKESYAGLGAEAAAPLDVPR